MAKSSRHVGRLLLSCANLGFRGTVDRTKRTETALVMCRACAPPQALIPVLHMAPSGFPSRASMRDALQAVRKSHEVFGQISDAQLRVTANTASGCNLAKTRGVIEDGVVKGTVAQIKLPVNAGTCAHELLAESWRQPRKE